MLAHAWQSPHVRNHVRTSLSSAMKAVVSISEVVFHLRHELIKMYGIARIAARRFHSSVRVGAKEAAAPAQTKYAELTVNFAVPDRSLVAKKEVKRITVPGRDGALGLEKNSPPILTELRPGVVRVDFMDNSAEEYFVPGGFAFKHPNNVIDVSAPDGVKLEHIDVEALRAANREVSAKAASAAAGSKEAAEVKVQLEVYRILSQALKVQL